MAARKVAKRIGITLGVLLLLLLATVLTYRWWLPYALRPVASRYDVQFEEFQKLGDGKFSLTDVERTDENFDFRASRVEGFFPDAWYRRASDPGTNEPPIFLQVEGWSLVIHDRDNEEEPREKKERSVYGEFERAEKYLAQIRKWLPRAVFLNGSVHLKEKEYSFQTITWDQGIFAADGIWPISQVPIEIKAKLTGEDPYQLSYAMHPLDLRARVRLWETNDTLRSSALALYKDSRVDIQATFGTNGILPKTATLKAPDFSIPPELLKLDQFREITGSASANWVSNRYSVDLKAHGEPLSTAENVPPLDVQLAASGDTNRVRVERAVSSAPGLELAISDPLELTYRGEMLSPRSEITVSAELEKLPWLKLKGALSGRIILEKGDRFPLVSLRAEGRDLSGYDLQATSLKVDAKLDWPNLEEFRANIELPANSSVAVTASGDLERREVIRASVTAEGQIALNLLPENVTYRRIDLEAQASGPLTNLAHSGKVTLRRLETAHTAPMDLQSSWDARDKGFEQLSLLARAGPATLLMNASIAADSAATNLTIRELRLSKGDELYLDLVEPAVVTLTNQQTSRMVVIQPFEWRGEDKRLALSGAFLWPSRGDISFAAHNIEPELFQFFVKRSLSGLDLPEFVLEAHWNEGPLYGRMRGDVSFLHDQFKRLAATVNVELDESGLTLSDFTVADPNGQIARARGFLPLSIRPLDPTKIVHLSKSDALEFTLQTVPNEAFWSSLEAVTKVRVTNAAVQLTLQGSARQPTGTLQFRTASLKPLQIEREMPAVGPIEGKIALDEQLLSVPRIDLFVEGQPLVISAEVKLGENFWTQRREEIREYLLNHAAVNVEAGEIQVAPFTKFLPRYVSPQGTVSIDAGIKPGRMLDGNLYVNGVATRPLPKLGVIEGIRANFSLNGRDVQIANLQGTIGGEVLRLSGAVSLAETNLARGYPGIRLQIEGNNIPLARNPDVILRSDLNLKVVNGTNWVPVISGSANLQDSFLLRDIATLVPGGVAGPSRRPPYFTIEQDPIDEWKLDVRVRGENFMRVRSPFFQGQVSTVMHVMGTLEEPMALGEASITSGRILFPFATLQVKQAIVSLTSENPYLPHVFAVAAGRAFGYDIRMEAEGPADEPVIEFSSVPALTSEQIILMITTGQVPRDDFAYSNQDKASRLAFFLGKNLLSKLNPGEPAQERFTIRSGEDISEQGRETYSVEYKINDRWSLVGEYDRFGALNADVKWKVFSR